MFFIVKNQDSENSLNVYMYTGKRLLIPADGQLDLIAEGYTRIQIANSDIPYHIDKGDIIVNNGTKDLTKLKALKYAYNSSEVKEMTIKEETIKTGGNFQAQTFTIDVASGTGWYETDISFPIPISLLSASYVGNDEIVGDEAQFLVARNTITGVITTTVSSGIEIDVSQTVADNAKIGYYITIDSEDLGRVVSIDSVNNKLTMENSITTTHTAGSYVKQTVKMAPRIVFGDNGVMIIGESKIGGSYISPGRLITARYNNISGGSKKFNFTIEYLY